MLDSAARQLRRRPRNRRFGILALAILALAAVFVIVVAAWPSGKGPGSSGSSLAAAGSRVTASHAAVPAQQATQAATAVPAQQPAQAPAAAEASLGSAVKPANSLKVAVWNAGRGGAALRAVSAQLGTVLMMHAAEHVPEMRQACQALNAAATAALAATPIPDVTMQLWYKRALDDIGAGAADCRAAISSKLHGDEDLVVHQDAALMSRAMSELTTGARELYKATAYVKPLERP